MSNETYQYLDLIGEHLLLSRKKLGKQTQVW